MIPQRKIEDEKARIIANCIKCGGASCSICQRYGSFIDNMAEAGIPVDYWFRDIAQWHGDLEFGEWLKSFYLAKLGTVYAEGKVLCLVGHRGVGKTMAACSVLKKAIISGYSTHYISLVDAVDNLVSTDAHEYRRILKLTDFLVVDEVDQRFFGSVNSRALYGNQFEGILRTRTQNKLPMIMCSNASDLDEIFTGEFQESFKSLRTQFLIEKVIRGEDARKKGE
jgi:DNA replication protein DnaC